MPPSSQVSKQGFALVIALGLMAFVLLLLLSITTMVQVETRSAQTGTERMLAQQNALLGLQQALGELQKAAGPDQRVTATAEIFDKNTYFDEFEPAREAARTLPNLRWVGVMPAVAPGAASGDLEDFAEDNRQHALGYTSDEIAAGTASLSDASNISWLVSMPEDLRQQLSISPTTVLDKRLKESLADPDDEVLIAAYGAEGDAPARDSDGQLTQPDTELLAVRAAKVPVSTDAGNASSGSFAWWVEDEGLKASFSLDDPAYDTASDSYDFNSTQADSPPDATLYPLLQARQANFNHAQYKEGEGFQLIDDRPYPKLIEEGILTKLMQGMNPGNLPDEWTTFFEQNSAGVTLGSFGVPTDPTTGRLKEDLTVYLETGKGLEADGDILRGGAGDGGYSGPTYPVSFGSHDNLPKFGILKGWNDLGKDVANETLVSRPQTLTEHGLHPHVKRFGILMSIAMTAPPPHTFDADGNLDRTIDPAYPDYSANFKLLLFPFVELWNPYSVPLPAEKYLAEVTVPDRVILHGAIDKYHPGQKEVGIAVDGLSNPSNATSDTVVSFNILADGMIDPVNPADYPFGEGRAWIRMVVDTASLDGPGGLMPGETLLFAPELGDIAHLAYNKDLQYRDYNSGTSVNLAENKRVDDSAYKAPNGCFIFSLEKPGTLPEPDPAKVRYFRVRYKNPSVKDGTSAAKWNDRDASNLFRLSLLDGSGPTLLTSMGPTRSFYDSPNAARKGWDWSIVGGGWNSTGNDSGSSAVNPFIGIPVIPNFNENRMRAGDTKFLEAAGTRPGWTQGGFRVMSVKNPRGGILRTEEAYPATWASSQHGEMSIHRNDQYEVDRFTGARRLPSREGIWGRMGGIEGFLGNVSEGGQSQPGTGTTYAHFDFPRSLGPIHSLGQLQHANLNPLPWGSALQVGFSRAPVLIDRDKLTDSGTGQLPNEQIDLPYLINASMLDRFYLSTIPQVSGLPLDGTPPLLANNRHKLYATPSSPLEAGNLQDSPAAFEQSAANILVEGSFNVNSTSVTAWESFLLSKAGLSMQVFDGPGRLNAEAAVAYNAGNEESFVAFPRVAQPVYGLDSNTDFDAIRPLDDRFVRAGNHVTDRAEIRELAKAIVREVKRRGPFLSMADFVNRRLIPNSSNLEADYLGLMGAMDAAILKTSQNPGMLNHQLIFGETNRYGPRLDTTNTPYPSSAADREIVYATPQGHADSALQGWSSYLMQGDILANLGAFMSARSDTFKIHAYGETVNPTTGNVSATARCEAVVQRISEPVALDDSVVAPGGPFGRRFKVVAFRWLDEL